MASRDKRIPFKNESGEVIPPYAPIEFAEDCDVNSGTGAITVKATKPTGAGPYALNTEKPVAASGEASYGECVIPLESLWWAKYTEEDPPETAWETEIGPVEDEWTVSTDGSGFIYAGLHEPENERILVKLVTDATPRAYIISHYDDGIDEAIAIFRDLRLELNGVTYPDDGSERLAKVKMVPARFDEDQATFFSVEAGPEYEDSEVEVYINFLSGVTFTGQLAMVKTIAGKKQWVGGWNGHYFWDCTVVDDIAAGDFGDVRINSRRLGYTGLATPTLSDPVVRAQMRVHEEDLFAGDSVALVFDDADQRFDIIKVGCAS